MHESFCQAGDVLFYFDAPNVETRLIQFGESIEEHAPGPWPYHVAIALNATQKIEADGKETAINPIDYGKFVICRPPYDKRKLPKALAWSRRQEGKLYGWFGILDQILRILFRKKGLVPRWLVEWADKRWPYCSYLYQEFAPRAGFTDIPVWPPATPADCWIPLRKYTVRR